MSVVKITVYGNNTHQKIERNKYLHNYKNLKHRAKCTFKQSRRENEADKWIIVSIGLNRIQI